MSTIKLIIEKGPRKDETLEYNSTSVIKVGRVVRGNTIAIKDAGISSKHICIQFDNQLLKWTLIDLDSSNGTMLNGISVKPSVSSCLSDGDCIKIGELTSVIVRIGTELEVVGRPNTRRNGIAVAVGESELGLGFDEGKAVEEVVAQKRNLRARGRKVTVVENEKEKAAEEVEVVQKRNLRARGNKKGVDVESEKAVVEEDVQKRDLRARGKKGLDVKIEVESLSCKRVLRSSKKGENMNVDVREMGEDVSVLIEPKKTRGGRKKSPVKVVGSSDLDGGKLVENGVPVEGKRTGRGRPRKKMVVESLEDNDAKESVRVGEGNEGAFDKGKADLLENVENTDLLENLDANKELVQDHLVERLETNNECVQHDLAEKLVLRQEGCEGKEAVVDRSLIKSPSKVADMDKGKEVVAELEYRHDGSEGMVNDSGPDKSRWVDLEKMTLGDFFDYMEVQLPKEIHEKIEKINSDLKENARKCHEFRLQINENRNGNNIATD